MGAQVTYTATVSGPGVIPTGSATFKDGANTVTCAGLDGGVGCFGPADMFGDLRDTVGSPHLITAVYGGDTNHDGSTSNTVTQTVNPAGSSTLLVSAPNPSAVGAQVTYTATVSGPGVIPTGSVTFKDGANTVTCAPGSTVALDVSGPADMFGDLRGHGGLAPFDHRGLRRGHEP